MTFDDAYDHEPEEPFFDDDELDDRFTVFPHDDLELDEDPRDLWAMRHRGAAIIEALEVEPPRVAAHAPA